MNFFIFYPNVYTVCKGGKLLVLDTKTGCSLLDRFDASETSLRIFEITSALQDFVDKCLNLKLGYSLECETKPFVPLKDLHIISSVNRSAKMMNFEEGFHTKEMVRQIHVWGHNSTFESISNVVSVQIDYPTANNSSELPDETICEIANSCADTLILSGDLDEYMTQRLIPATVNTNKIVIVRTVFQKSSVEKYKRLLSEYETLAFEIIVFSRNEAEEIATELSELKERITLVQYVESEEQAQDFFDLETENKTAVIAINDFSTLKSLIDEMLIDEKDIFQPGLNGDEISKKKLFNTNFFGAFTIDCEGTVFCGTNLIGNIHRSSLFDLLNKWIHQKNNAWDLSREKWKPCKDCLLSSLCPPVSIYELQGIIERMCTNETDRTYNLSALLSQTSTN